MNKLYRITQDDVSGYDTYDSAVVCATNEEDARNTYPGQMENDGNDWTLDPSKVDVTYLGEADNSLKTGVICASFNAG